jgi:hypothetical protein
MYMFFDYFFIVCGGLNFVCLAICPVMLAQLAEL